MNDYLDRVEAELSRLTEQGAHRRLRARAGEAVGGGGSRPPRRGTEALAFGSAVAVVAAVVAIVLLNVHTGKPHRTAAPASSGERSTPTETITGTAVPAKPTTVPSVIPVPSHFAPQSFTAIDEFTWWLLGPGPCTIAGERPPCGAILHTANGGRSFVGVPAPPASLSGAADSGSGYSQLRFADAKDGFAYGPDLYDTHDGGLSWHPVDVGGAVTDLAISAGEAYATVSSAGAGKLIHSPVDHDAWTTLPAAGDVSVGLWAQGSDVLVQSGSGGGIGNDVLVSHDGGASFASHPSPSPGLGCQFEEADVAVMWAHCATGTESGVWRSTNAGQNFQPANGGSVGLHLPNSAAFAAASDTTAVVGYQQLYRTEDGGAGYTPAGPAGVTAWAYLGFTDATHGVGIGFVGPQSPSNERLFYTIDGGVSYHLVPLP